MDSVFSINGRLFDKSIVDAYLDCDSSIPIDVACAASRSPPRSPPRSTPTLTDDSSGSPSSTSSSLLPEDCAILDAAGVLMSIYSDPASVLMRIRFEEQLFSPDGMTSPTCEPPITFVGLGEGVPLPSSNKRTKKPSRKMREGSSTPAVRTRRRHTTPPPPPPATGTSSTPSAPAAKKRKCPDDFSEGKGPYTHIERICAAIISRPDRKMPLSSLLHFISRNFYLPKSDDQESQSKDEKSGSKKRKGGQERWQSSVRHFLTINSAFKNVPRSYRGRIDDGDGGMGGLWTMDVNEGAAQNLIAKMRDVTFPLPKEMLEKRR